VYTDLFPEGKLNIRPPKNCSSAVLDSDCFVAEIKRSMESGHEAKIDKFVRFYAGIFGNTFQLSEKQFGKPLWDAVNNPLTKILFVFNGTDLHTVQTTMRRVINRYMHNEDMMIHNHQVVCVWCDSASLINWKLSMEYEDQDRVIKEQARVNKEQARKIQDLERRLQQHQANKTQEQTKAGRKRKRGQT
jgi:hypothetical protein